MAKPVTASVNVIVTAELLSVSFRAASEIATVAVGFSVSMSTASVADGLVYVGDYAGLYCTGCEEFKQPAQIVPVRQKGRAR